MELSYMFSKVLDEAISSRMRLDGWQAPVKGI